MDYRTTPMHRAAPIITHISPRRTHAVPTDHAGMSTAQRVLVQNSWQRGDTRVVVATIAYGACAGVGRWGRLHAQRVWVL